MKELAGILIALYPNWEELTLNNIETFNTWTQKSYLVKYLITFISFKVFHL